jgi:hypothetical protein
MYYFWVLSKSHTSGDVRFDSHEISVLASPLSRELGFEKSGVINTTVSLSPKSDRSVVPDGDGVNKSKLLPGAIVVREVCDFLATLAAAYPGFPVD